MEKSYKCHEYGSYEEYIKQQLHHANSMYRTSRKSYDVYYNRIMEDFKEFDINKLLCIGSRDVSEVNYFRNKGIDATGIDLFSADQSIIRLMDMHDIGTEFNENEFDAIFSCHSLEHSVKPDVVLEGMRKISKHGAFIVLPLSGRTHAKDPVMFNFMEKAGEEGDTQVSLKDVQSDFGAILDGCEVRNLTQLPLFPNTEDGFWFSVIWNKL